MPDTLNVEIVDGSIVPDDCMYPDSITDGARFEIACVTMPRIISAEISAQYIKANWDSKAGGKANMFLAA